MSWSMAELLAFARLAQAAYQDNSKVGTEAVAGVEWVGQVGNTECQATLARLGAMSLVIFRGTQFGGVATALPELWDDINNRATVLAPGTKVKAGVYGPMADLWPELEKLAPEGRPISIGHSLGGARAHLSVAFSEFAEVVTFGAIAAADAAYWWLHGDGYESTRVVHEADFAPDWSAPWVQPGPMLWLREGKARRAVARPGVNTSILSRAARVDHEIENYIAALGGIAGT